MTVYQSYLGQMQPPCEDQMLVAGQYQGSDDSDSEDDQFTEGNRGSIGNFLGGRDTKLRKLESGREETPAVGIRSGLTLDRPTCGTK